MIDRDKVISRLQIIRTWAEVGKNYNGIQGEDCLRDVVDWIDDALALLKEQEPVKPAVDIDTWKCGNCGHTLEHQELLGDNVLFHEQYNFCPECGRPVKWE